MSETSIDTRRRELLARVLAANPSDIETVELLAEVEEFLTTLGVYPSPELVQAQGVSDGNLITRLQGIIREISPTLPNSDRETP